MHSCFAGKPLALAAACIALVPLRALAQGDPMPDAPAVKAAVLRATVGAEAAVADAIDAALLRDLSALAGIDSPTVSPIDYAEIQLTVGCSDEGRECLASIAKLAQVNAVVVRRLTVAPESASLSLTHFDATSTDEPARAEQSFAKAEVGDPMVRAVPGLVRRLFGIPEPVKPAAEESSTSTASAGPGATTPDHADASEGGRVGPLTWVALGVGAAVLAGGMIVGAGAKGDFDDYKTVPIADAEDARRAGAKFDDAESSGTLATILIPTGGVLLALGVTLLVIDLSSEPSEKTSLALAPRDGGAVLSLHGTWGEP